MAKSEMPAHIRSTVLRFFALNIIDIVLLAKISVLEYLNTTASMREYQQKHIVRTLLYSRVTMVALFLLIVLLLRSIMELNDKRLEANIQRDETKNERMDLEVKVEKIRKQNEFINTERGFEEYVRTTYPVVKDGEGVIVIYDDESEAVSEVREKMTAWEKISVYWNSLFGSDQ